MRPNSPILSAEPSGQFQSSQSRFDNAAQVQEVGLTVSNPPTQAEMQAIDDKLDEVITGLTNGTQYWFQIRAMGAAGPSAGSDPATKRAT
jgi:hypothetical protein